MQLLGSEALIQQGLLPQSHLLQQQITIQDKIPRATTMTKDAMITYSTLHSEKKKKKHPRDKDDLAPQTVDCALQTTGLMGENQEGLTLCRTDSVLHRQHH